MQSPTLIADSTHTPRSKNSLLQPSKREFEPIPGWWLQFAVYMSMLSGIGAIMSQKAMNKSRYWRCENLVAPECSISYFSSPLLQIVLGAIGASACWGLYSIERWYAIRHGRERGQFELLIHKESLLKPESGNWIWILPALYEFAAGWLCNLAMTITYASTVLMLRTFNTAVVAFITTFWLRTPLRLYHWYGVVIVTLGTVIAVTFAASVEDPDTPYSKTESYLGAIAALLSCLFTSLKVCTEEKLLKTYRMAPFKAAGLQGIVQCLMASFTLLFTWNQRSLRASIFQLRHSTDLQYLAYTFVITIFLFNASLIVISKLASSLLRTILHAFRTMLIYLIELWIGWSSFHFLDLSSVVTSTLGLLVYMDIIPTPQGDKFVTGDFSVTPEQEVQLALTAPETNTVNPSHTLVVV